MAATDTPSDLPPPPYAKEDPTEPSEPKEDTEANTVQPVTSVPIQEKPSFPPPAYSEKPGIVISDITETRGEENSRLDSVVSPLLWLAVILSILMFSPCGYLAFAFTCFAFWSETGGNLQVARYLSSVARICAIAAFLMGVLILLSPQVTKWDREPYCLFAEESYRICL